MGRSPHTVLGEPVRRSRQANRGGSGAPTSGSERNGDHDRDRDRGPGPLGRTRPVGAADSVPLLPRPTRARALGRPCPGAGLSRRAPLGSARGDRRLARRRAAASSGVVPRRRTPLSPSRDESCVTVPGHSTRERRDRRAQVHRLRVEIVCVDCGYAAIVATRPARCPMCGGSTWRRRHGTDGTKRSSHPSSNQRGADDGDLQ